MSTLLYRSPTPGRPDIVSDEEIVFGEPTIAGTNITVHLLLGKLGAGYTEAQMQDSYPRMPAGSLAAAQEYAKEVAEGRLPEAWSPIIGEPFPWQAHVYAGLTDEEIDDLTEAIREARMPLSAPSRP